MLHVLSPGRYLEKGIKGILKNWLEHPAGDGRMQEMRSEVALARLCRAFVAIVGDGRAAE